MTKESVADILEAQLQAADWPQEIQGLANEKKSARVTASEDEGWSDKHA
jgi:hypothetical protein